MEQIITEIIKVGGGKLMTIFTPAVIEGLIVNPEKEPLPNIVVYIGGEKTTTKMSGKFFIKIKRGIYDIGIEYNGKKYDNVEGIHVGSGEKISTTITIPSIIIEEKPSIPQHPVEPRIITIDQKTSTDESGNTENTEIQDSETSHGPTRFARKYIQKQPVELQTIIYSLIEGLSSSVTYHKSGDPEDHLILRQSKDPDWSVYIISRPRKKVIEIIFEAEADEVITGENQGETYGDKLAEFQCHQLAKKYKNWGNYMNCQLNLDSSESEIESVRLAINWFLLESYKY